MTVILSIYAVLMVACLFMLLRNNVAYRLRTEALKRVSSHASYLIEHGDTAEWRLWYDRLEARSYDSIMWDPFCWRVEQAYPWITSLDLLEPDP